MDKHVKYEFVWQTGMIYTILKTTDKSATLKWISNLINIIINKFNLYFWSELQQYKLTFRKKANIYIVCLIRTQTQIMLQFV